MKKSKVRLRWSLCLILCLLTGILFRYNALVYTRVYPVYRAVQGYGIAQRISHYENEQVKNFSIRYHSSNIDKLNDLENIIREYGDRVFNFFGFIPDRSIEIILFDNEQHLQHSLGIPDDQPTIGAYSGGKIALLAQQEHGVEEDMLINSFVHELAHLVIDEMAGGNFPTWFTEGSALYMEYRLLDYEWGQELVSMEPYSMEELTSHFDKLDEYCAYRQAFVYVRDLIERVGWDNYLALLQNLKNGRDFSTEFMKF